MSEPLSEPLVAHKRNIASGNIELEDKLQEALRHLRKTPSGKVSDENKLTALFRSLIFACRNRKPYSLLHDEAQRISHVGSGRKLSDQLEAIVCLTDAAATPFTFFGDYGFLDISDMSPHLSRRLEQIELRRYQLGDEYPEDEANFLNLVAGYQGEIRIHPEPDLVSNHIYLYQRSLGNPGMLKDWLTNTLVETLREGRPDDFLGYLEKTSPSDTNLITRLAQIKLGESRFKSNEQTEATLNDELGMTIRHEEARAPSRKRSGRIGIPNPERYPVDTTNLTEASKSA